MPLDRVPGQPLYALIGHADGWRGRLCVCLQSSTSLPTFSFLVAGGTTRLPGRQLDAHSCATHLILTCTEVRGA